jgi:hypothetical protein
MMILLVGNERLKIPLKNISKASGVGDHRPGLRIGNLNAIPFK